MTARSRLPATSRTSGPLGACEASEYSAVAWPTKTPVRLPASAEGRMPASSSASQAVWSSSRCWGSTALASAGDMPKKAWSKAKASVMKPPWREAVLPGVPGAGS
ncbi:hypothetical protein GCM10009663_26270 [Kitasatospora arboriphila]|uniref:Uncharacterized protein n=1 Tax=Kitasatospora arboriphila TaxID=258052 RepID=A0ABN1TIW7_9ACTN